MEGVNHFETLGPGNKCRGFMLCSSALPGGFIQTVAARRRPTKC